MEVVEGDQLRLVVAAPRGGAPNRVAGAGMQRVAVTEREPVVGGVAQQCVAERQVAELVLDDERLEPGPDRVMRPGHVVNDIGEEVGGKGLAQDGHPPEQVAVGGAEAIDVGDDDALDRVGQGADGVPLQHRRNELPHEERVAPGAVDEELDLSTGQGGLPRRRQGELGGLRLTQRIEFDDGDRGVVGRDEARTDISTGETPQP